MKRRSIEADLQRLRVARADPSSPAARATIEDLLEHGQGMAAAAAAEVAGANELEALGPLMSRAFDRFMVDPVASDPACRAKIAIAEALCRLGWRGPEPFLVGIRHRQLEAAWGKPVDTAAPLRAHCGMGLALADHPRAAAELAVLLADAEGPARAGAARALGSVPAPESEPLLRFKALAGDEEPQVVGDCLRSLLAVAPAASMPFVGAFLDEAQPETICEQAALALGESRIEGAFGLLRAWLESGSGRAARRAALVAIALTRERGAFDFLIEQIARADAPTAADAIDAIGAFRHDEELRSRALDAARRRLDQDLVRTAEKALRGR